MGNLLSTYLRAAWATIRDMSAPPPPPVTTTPKGNTTTKSDAEVGQKDEVEKAVKSSTGGQSGSAATSVALNARIGQELGTQEADAAKDAVISTMVKGSHPKLAFFLSQLMSSVTTAQEAAEKFKAMSPDLKGYVIVGLAILFAALEMYGKMKMHQSQIEAVWPLLAKGAADSGGLIFKHEAELKALANSKVGKSLEEALTKGKGVEAEQARSWIDPTMPWVKQLTKKFLKSAEEFKEQKEEKKA